MSSHLNYLLTSIEFSKDPTLADKDSAIQPKLEKLPPHVSVTAIVGGMSAQKQKRVLDRGVDVLVATPGRLWDIIQDVGHIRYILRLSIGSTVAAYRTTIWQKR